MKTTDNMKKLMIQSSEIAAVMNRDEEFYGGVVGQSRGERTGQADARTEKDSERAVKRADKTTSKAKRSHKYRDFKGDSDGEKDYKKAFKADKSVIIGEDKTNFMTENTQNEVKMNVKNDFTELAREEKPEYKYFNSGLEMLNIVDLISLIIGNGRGNRKTVEQARQIVNICDGSLKSLSKKRTEEIEVVQGVGDGKAIAILAALELGVRARKEKAKEMNYFCSATAIYNYMHPTIGALEHEEAYIILMNQNYKLIKSVKLSSGGITETAVDVRVIMKEAVINNATILALCHNHPSNNTSPSEDDDRLTQRVKKACELMRIHFTDHLIITDGFYYSYREEGRL